MGGQRLELDLSRQSLPVSGPRNKGQVSERWERGGGEQDGALRPP